MSENGDTKGGGSQDSQKQGKPWLRAFLLTPVTVFVHFLAFVLFSIITVSVVGQYEYYFTKHDAALPSVAVSILSMSHELAKFWYLGVLALMLIDAPILFCLYLLPQRWAWLRALWHNGFLVMIILASIFILLAMIRTLDPLQTPLELFHTSDGL